MYRLHVLALAVLSVPAAAAERTIGIGSFDRLRVDGVFDVRVVTGGSPRARVSGDADALDAVDLRVDGTTLHIRRRSGAIGGARTASAPVVVTLSAQTLVSVAMLGGGSIRVTGMRTTRADLSVAGAGTIAVDGVAAEQANASVIGTGTITLAGRALRAKLLTNGPGAIDAAALVADDLTVALDGPGETNAQARYVASVTTTGLGRVVVTGNAKCTVRAASSGTVICGR